ncbi:MAG: hypothetical protein KatS3mg076_2803 [Candidatus Binatia bacterium]|nr:MAG: hypothetical protein KatS3mg076_2803 [Candidatus Binatia bacterium]
MESPLLRSPLSLDRRSFLRLSAFSAAMLAVSRLGPVASSVSAADVGRGLRVLGPEEARIFTAIAERIVETGDPEMPRFGDTQALSTVDTALYQLDPELRRQFGWALWLFEYGPILFDFRFSRFTSLAPEEQDAHIEGWRESRFLFRRLAYQAVRNLAFLGYYAQDATWKKIHYTGPWVPRPRRVV